MNSTTNRTVAASVVQMYEPAVSAVMNMVAQGKIADSLAERLGLADVYVRSARLRVIGKRLHHSFAHFVWLLVDRSRVSETSAHFASRDGVNRSVSETLEGEEDGLSVRTNDIDLMVGYPPSYFGHAPVRYTQGFAAHVCEFLADNLHDLAEAELLVQIETENGQVINLITDSVSGWDALKSPSHCE